MTSTSCHIRNLSVHSRSKTLLTVDELAIPHGCHTAIIGPNGAGKSTLLKALIGQTGKGQIELFGQAVAPQLKQGKVAWVGQHGRYQLPLTVREYIELSRPTGGWPLHSSPTASPEADALLDYFDLADLADKRIQTLSGGEQQRANIIRALLQHAPLLLLDEPCNHLDIRHQHSLMQYLNRHRAGAVFKRRQRNIVQYHQIHRLAFRPRFAIGRYRLARALPAALLPVCRVHTHFAENTIASELMQ